MIDPHGLGRFVGKQIDYEPANCDNTFKHTLRFIVPYARRAGLEPEQVLEWIRAMGANCDCEFGVNVCVPYMEDR